MVIESPDRRQFERCVRGLRLAVYSLHQLAAYPVGMSCCYSPAEPKEQKGYIRDRQLIPVAISARRRSRERGRRYARPEMSAGIQITAKSGDGT